MTIQYVSTSKAPAAIGPYSQAVRQGNHIFSSGQIPLNLDGKIVSGGIEAQTRRVLDNLSAILAAEKVGLANVIKTTVFLTDLADFATMNTIYGEYFGQHKPARSTIQVAALPLGSLLEIEAVALC